MTTGTTAHTCNSTWLEKESEKLFEAVKEHGSNWSAVALLIPGRNKTECQARWKAELDAARAATKIYMRPPQPPQGEAPNQMLKKDDEVILVAKRPRFNSRKLQKDEDTQAAKKRRVDSPVYTSVDVVAASQIMDAVKTSSHSNWVVVASTCSATAASLEQPSIWKPAEEDTEVTESRTGEVADLAEEVEILGKGLVAVAELDPVQADAQCPQILANTVIPSSDPTIADNKLGRWKPEEDTKLIAAVAALEKLGKKEWTEVAKLVPGRTNNQCRIRWIMQLDPSGGPTVNMGSWTEGEYVELVGAVKRHGSKLVSGRKNWSKELRLAVAATHPNRSALQQQHPVNSSQGEAPPQKLQQAEDTLGSKRSLFETPLSNAIDVLVATQMSATEKIALHSNVASAAFATVASHAQSLSVTVPTTYTGKWTNEENENLFEAVKQHGNTNWIAVAQLVQGRDKSQCHAKWTAELDAARAASKLYASPPSPPRRRTPNDPQSQQRTDTTTVAAPLAPHQMLQQDEDIPAAKRPRFETTRSTAQVEVVDLSMAGTVATTSCDERVVVASTNAAILASDAHPRNWWRWWQQQ